MYFLFFPLSFLPTIILALSSPPLNPREEPCIPSYVNIGFFYVFTADPLVTDPGSSWMTFESYAFNNTPGHCSRLVPANESLVFVEAWTVCDDMMTAFIWGGSYLAIWGKINCGETMLNYWANSSISTYCYPLTIPGLESGTFCQMPADWDEISIDARTVL